MKLWLPSFFPNYGQCLWGRVRDLISSLLNDSLNWYALVLTVSQFKRFMEVIKKLGDRVEKEHDQYLRDSQRVEDRSAINGTANIPAGPAGAVDFESLVGNSGSAPIKTNATGEAAKTPSWEDDVWGSIFSNGSSVSPHPR